jgi:polyisoprenyl-teichoic acid--peptidoglycan teichoic acid transferase
VVPLVRSRIVSDGSRRSRRRRTWPQRLLITLNIVVVLICFSSAAGLAYVFKQASDVQRYGGLGSTLDQTADKGRPENFLLVGVDNSEGLDAKDPVLIGRSRASLLSDTIMILRIDPGTNQASILSLPRDLWVPIADTGGKQRINTALPGGGPERLIKTIQQDFGIPINHYVQVNFHGFKSLVDAVGGVPIYFPWPARDTNTGFGVDQPGCVMLNGTDALAYARSRHFETRTGKGNTWVGDPSSDFGRISRQQEFIKLALKRAIAKGVRNPFVLNQLVGVATGNVTLDDQITTQDLLNLGSEFRNFDPDSLQNYTPPTSNTVIGGADVLLLDNLGAQPIFAKFRNQADAANPLRAIQVQVQNGSGAGSQAAQVVKQLDGLGFTTFGSGDSTSFRNAQTQVRYAPGAEASAVELASYLVGTPQFTLDKTLTGTSLTLVTGKDFQGLRTDPRPATDYSSFLATTTTTTAPPAGSASAIEPPTTSAGMVPATPDGQACG